MDMSAKKEIWRGENNAWQLVGSVEISNFLAIYPVAFEHFYEAFLDHWEKTLYKCIIIIIIIYLSRPGHGTFSDFFLILIPGGRRGEGRIEGRDGHHWNLTCPNNLACVQPPPPLGKIGERDVCVLPLIIVFRGHVIFSRICGK